jgi:prepilin-type N-terminal cleavage/methylation domain-containing protein
MHKRQSGLTLVELLVVLTMSAILATALSYTFAMMVNLQTKDQQERATVDQTTAMQTEIERTLEGARLDTQDTLTSTSTTVLGQATYFQGISDGGQGEEGSDRITFTTTQPGVPMAAVSDTDDFETQQQTRGPVGGLSEVSIGLTPVGDAGNKTGLFERTQTPSDADTTQGGNESDIDSDIATIGFEFWDGLEWQPTWDTTQMTPARLPEAVQVTYTIKNETGSPQHVFVVPIPASDVTPNNPVTSEGSSVVGATS